MIEKFTHEQFLLANYQLALENSAMIDIMLGNQVAIMKHLGIPVETKKDLLTRNVPKLPNPSPDKELLKQLTDARIIASLNQIRIWSLVQEIEKMRKEGDEWVLGKGKSLDDL